MDSDPGQGGGSKKPPRGDGDVVPPPDDPERKPPPPDRAPNKPKRIIPRLINRELGDIIGWGERAEGAERAIAELTPEKIQVMIKDGKMTRDELQITRNFYLRKIKEEKGIGVAEPRSRLAQKILEMWPNLD